MRYANQLRLRGRIQNELPAARVSAAYDGPSGYVLIVDAPAVGSVIVRSEADWRRLQSRFKKPKSS
jgi:hypothetical protein